MHIALIADTFPPLRSSGAVQLRDLSREFVRQGHTLTVILPSSGSSMPWLIEDFNGVQVLRLRAPKTKDINYVHRTINEFLMPFAMLNNFRKSPFAKQRWDGVVWYSPSIFLGPIVSSLKKINKCKAYLIIRDIFPEWAVDMGLMSQGLAYRFFKIIANYQYSVADVIGIQAQGNQIYFRDRKDCEIEVLQNWLTDAQNVGCSISLANTVLAGRKIFVYAGNMGVAQGVGVFLELAERLCTRKDIGFVFVGRGSYAHYLREDAQARGLDNIIFFDEIDPTEIPGLYAQCHIGIVALDPRHKTHNIPGKFLSYMQAGLPVLASINAGNALEEMILSQRVGRVCNDYSVDTLLRLAINLVNDVVDDAEINQALSARCKALSEKLFSPEVAVKQIVSALTS
jgi:glycosyltransferase involved in cell wall biosynthesis